MRRLLYSYLCIIYNAGGRFPLGPPLPSPPPPVLARFYGCGSPIPPLLAGCTALDLGCGTGRDVYVMSQARAAPTFSQKNLTLENIVDIDSLHEKIHMWTEHFTSIPCPSWCLKLCLVKAYSALHTGDCTCVTARA